MCFPMTNLGLSTMTSFKKVTRQQPTTGSSNIAAQTGNTYISETVTVSIETPTAKLSFSTRTSSKKVSLGSHIVIVVAISGFGDHIAISGCPSLSQSFRDTFFQLVVVENLDFVARITIIYTTLFTIHIFYPFCHISRHKRKISLLSKKNLIRVWCHD